jgi:hypothetical protein
MQQKCPLLPIPVLGNMCSSGMSPCTNAPGGSSSTSLCAGTNYTALSVREQTHSPLSENTVHFWMIIPTSDLCSMSSPASLNTKMILEHKPFKDKPPQRKYTKARGSERSWRISNNDAWVMRQTQPGPQMPMGTQEQSGKKRQQWTWIRGTWQVWGGLVVCWQLFGGCDILSLEKRAGLVLCPRPGLAVTTSMADFMEPFCDGGSRAHGKGRMEERGLVQ